MKSKDPYVLKNEMLAERYDEFVKGGFAGYLKINHNFVEDYKVFEQADSHMFFGYYDLPQISPDGNKMLIMCTDKLSQPEKDEAYVFYIDLNDYSYHMISSTRAWCWQQGCRMRWVSDSNSLMIMNNAVDGRYVSEIWDVDKRKMLCRYPYAFYDIAFKKNYGLGTDFSRLQKMRPGYGYNSLHFKSSDDCAAPQTGIFKYDFKLKKCSNIISLKQLAQEVISEITDYHYINHICISPNEERFIFFHLWAKDETAMWNMRLIVSDTEGNYKVIEDKEIISHYCWINNDEIIVTRIAGKEEKCFVIYNVNNGKKRIINNSELVNDGHPVILPDKEHFVADTYPLDNCVQKLFIASLTDNEGCIELARAFSDPRLYIEHRCDMHPRADALHNIITIDSTYSDGIRKCILFKIKKGVLYNYL